MEKLYTAAEVAQMILVFQNEIALVKSQLNNIHNLLFPKQRNNEVVTKTLSLKEKKELKIREAYDKLKRNAINSKSKQFNH